MIPDSFADSWELVENVVGKNLLEKPFQVIPFIIFNLE